MRILKFWFHLPKKERAHRLKKARKDPARRLHASEADWAIFKDDDAVMPIAERYLRKTSTAEAPWEIVEATDSRHRNLAVARRVLSALTEGAASERGSPAPPTEPIAPPSHRPGGERLAGCQRVRRARRPGPLDHPALRDLPEAGSTDSRTGSAGSRDGRSGRRVSSVVVFEGWDAAGKGGAIRRLTGAMDAADYRVVSIAAPTDEEKAHHYLWRFWRQLPRAGRMLIFDRSWYGRVLVERVEGFAREDEWRRAYAEINDFEEQLVEHGIPVFKFWLHIDPDEQLRRLEARAHTPYKKYKLTDEDYRNREKWPAYTVAVNEMVARTSTEIAPWHLVPANDKRHARVAVLEAVCDGLKRAVKKSS